MPKMTADERAGQGAHGDLEEHGVVRIGKPEAQRLGPDALSLTPQDIEDGMPAGIAINRVIGFGYVDPASAPPASVARPRRPIEDLVHWDRW